MHSTYQAVFRTKKEREEKIAHLEGVVAQGGKDAAKAKAELMNLKSHDQAEDTSNEISIVVLLFFPFDSFLFAVFPTHSLCFSALQAFSLSFIWFAVYNMLNTTQLRLIDLSIGSQAQGKESPG
jgi:hypothetical protein